MSEEVAVGENSPVVVSPSKKASKVGIVGNQQQIVKAKRPKAPKNHPPVSEMVISAVKTLKERGGSSLQAIKKYMTANYKVDCDKLAPFIKKYLKNAVLNGQLLQTKGKGASGSFKLAVNNASNSGKKDNKKNIIDNKKNNKGNKNNNKKTTTTIGTDKKVLKKSNVSKTTKKTSSPTKIKKPVAKKLSEKKSSTTTTTLTKVVKSPIKSKVNVKSKVSVKKVTAAAAAVPKKSATVKKSITKKPVVKKATTVKK